MEAIKTIVNKVSVPSEKKTKQKEYLSNGALPIIDQGQTLIGGYTNDTSKTIVCDLPVIVFGDHTCCVKYIDFPFGAGADGIKVIKPKEGVLPKYLYYGMQYLVFKLSNRGYGRHYQYIEKMSLNVPSISQQERIVSQIEESLSQLDSAVETLKKTKQQLEIYRQAVLKEAFQGGYTTAWRNENTDTKSTINDYQSIEIRTAPFKDISGDENEINLDLPKEWLYLRIGEVFDVEVGSTPSRQNNKYWNGNINWVSSGEVRFNHINSTNECITEDGLKNSSTNLQPIGTVMLAMIGEGKTRGQAAILDIPAAHNQNTAAILVSRTPCDPKYIYYFLQLNYNHTRRVGSGNNQKALNKERVKALHFPFATFEEQRIIVDEIECRLSLCEETMKTVDQSLQQSEALRQSILKQAFEG